MEYRIEGQIQERKTFVGTWTQRYVALKFIPTPIGNIPV